MPMTSVQRALGIMALVKGPASSTTNTIAQLLAEVPGAKADEWGAKFYAAGQPLVDGNGDARAWGDLTNDEKGTYFVNALRAHFRAINQTATIPTPVEAARTSARSTADTATTTDLGADE